MIWFGAVVTAPVPIAVELAKGALAPKPSAVALVPDAAAPRGSVE